MLDVSQIQGRTVAEAAALDIAWSVSCSECDHETGLLALALCQRIPGRWGEELEELLRCRHCGRGGGVTLRER